MSEKPKVSILISTYGELAYTKRCLAELEETLAGKLDYEVLIIDDASKDDTPKFLKSLSPDSYRVFFNEENKGYAKNNNFLVREAKGDYLCFLNNGVFVKGDWLLPMLDVFETKKDVGMVGNVQRLEGSKKYDHMGVVFAPQGNPRHYGQGFYYRPFKGQVRKWSAVTAACCVCKSEVFFELGGFDEIFVNGCEDVDLCLRMGQEGLAHYVVHDSVVEHVRCASAGRLDNNTQNESLLNDRWRKEIAESYIQKDTFLHASWYIVRSILRPQSADFKLFFECILILLIKRK